MSNHEFTNAHYKLLKRFFKSEKIAFTDIRNTDLLNSLINNNFITDINNNHSYSNATPYENRIYAITYVGRTCVETHRRDTIRFYLSIGITNLISFAALIVSIIALLTK